MNTRALTCFLFCTAMVISGCHTYEVFRGARVPRPAPLARTGQPMGNQAEVSLAAQTAIDTNTPSLGDDAAGVHVPRHQGRVDVRLRAADTNLDVGLIYERGLEAGSHALAKGSPEPDGDAVGTGLSLFFSVPTSDPRWHVGIGAELLAYSIPWVEYRVCIDGCQEPFVLVDEGRSVRAVGGFSVIPSFRPSEHWSLYGGLTARNHPTIPRTGIEGDIDLGAEVEGGPLNVTAIGGVEYQHQSGIRASLHAYQTLTANPVQYYPVVGLAVVLPLWRLPSRDVDRSRAPVYDAPNAE